MYRITRTLLLLVVLAIASPMLTYAQIVGATYYECDVLREAQADNLVENIIGPAIEKHIEAGDVSAWGYWTHRAGGNWSRIFAGVYPDIESLMTGRDAIIAKLSQGAVASATREFLDICPSHKDYFWSIDAASAPIDDLVREEGMANYSSYYTCDMSRSERLAEIIALASPEMNAAVTDGLLDSWMWGGHIMGGPETHVFSYRGASHASLLTGIHQLQSRLFAKHPDETREFAEICSTHQDYLWDIKIMR